ncbi:MAG TPA: DUF3014 domain-containing protein [Anaeromyxobacteraceae bacterium]|nr:DUF3014 domain-containing protein [Anaeromyxobacteraceae bacterium]
MDDLHKEKKSVALQPRTALRRSDATPWIVVGAAVIVLLFFVGYRYLHHLTNAAGQPAMAQAPVADVVPASPQSVHESAGNPTGTRSLLEAVSSNPLFRSWGGQGDLVRRWAILTDNLAEGVSPRKALTFVSIGGPFSVSKTATGIVIAPASYHRYDAIADTVASVDAQALARLYQHLHPELEAVYRALGYPDARLDQVTAHALHRISAAPVVEHDLAVAAQSGGYFAFVDAGLENLPQVEKHLLRMGPRNTRLLQAKAREIAHALGLPEMRVSARRQSVR